MNNAADSKAENLLRLAGYSPVWAGFSFDASELQAEWKTEEEARAFAAEYGKHKPVTVENVPDLGWCTQMRLA